MAEKEYPGDRDVLQPDFDKDLSKPCVWVPHEMAEHPHLAKLISSGGTENIMQWYSSAELWPAVAIRFWKIELGFNHNKFTDSEKHKLRKVQESLAPVMTACIESWRLGAVLAHEKLNSSGDMLHAKDISNLQRFLWEAQHISMSGTKVNFCRNEGDAKVVGFARTFLWLDRQKSVFIDLDTISTSQSSKDDTQAIASYHKVELENGSYTQVTQNLARLHDSRPLAFARAWREQSFEYKNSILGWNVESLQDSEA
jgi:hypothetical protein